MPISGRYTPICTTSTCAITSTPGILYGVLMCDCGGTRDGALATLTLTNDTDGLGDAVITVAAPPSTSVYHDFTGINGIAFDTAIYGTVAVTGGASIVAHLFVE